MVLKFLTKMPRQFYKKRTVLSTNSTGTYANTHTHTHTHTPFNPYSTPHTNVYLLSIRSLNIRVKLRNFKKKIRRKFL